jgi:phosphoribosyl-ATP pyrophosphohydrolase/phosphoribosyl-AMP cyclohydrolase
MSDLEAGDSVALKLDAKGLIPVVVQDVNTDEVLMLAYMNMEALAKTTQTGKMHYFSRERNTLWMKGEESGNWQEMVSLRLDCDMDAILAKVRQKGKGVACHTGERSCFFNPIGGEGKRGADILAELTSVIKDRKENPSEGSYTNLLMNDMDMLGDKVREEAGELVLAAKGSTEHELVHEAADLLYHMLVLLRAKDVELEQVWDKLDERRN